MTIYASGKIFGGCNTSGYMDWKKFISHKIKDSQISNEISERKSNDPLSIFIVSTLNISPPTSVLS